MELNEAIKRELDVRIPDEVWYRLAKFLLIDRASGSITLHVARGLVAKLEVREYHAVDRRVTL